MLVYMRKALLFSRNPTISRVLLERSKTSKCNLLKVDALPIAKQLVKYDAIFVDSTTIDFVPVSEANFIYISVEEAIPELVMKYSDRISDIKTEFSTLFLLRVKDTGKFQEKKVYNKRPRRLTFAETEKLLHEKIRASGLTSYVTDECNFNFETESFTYKGLENIYLKHSEQLYLFEYLFEKSHANYKRYLRVILKEKFNDADFFNVVRKVIK